MKIERIAVLATVGGTALLEGVGCGQQPSRPSTSSTATASQEYSIQIQASTPGTLPKCTSSLAGTVAYVASPASLWTCSGGQWNQVECDGDEAGRVAYAASTQTLWACVAGGWTQVALPKGGTEVQTGTDNGNGGIPSPTFAKRPSV